MPRTKVKPYTLVQAQQLVREAKERMAPVHRKWSLFEHVYRTGMEEGWELGAHQVPGELFTLVPNLTLDAINLTLPHINIILSSVIARDPKHLAVPVAGGELAEAAVKYAEGVIAYYWRRTRATDDLRDATQDAMILGNGFVKTGWTHDQVLIERDEADQAQEFSDLLEMDRRFAVLEDREPRSVEELRSQVAPLENLVLADEPFVEYVSPYDVFVPIDARRMWESRWVAQRITLPVDEIKANQAFSNVSRLEADAFGSDEHVLPLVGHEVAPNQSADGMDVFDTATIYEFYDLRTGRLQVFQLDGEKQLFNDEIPYSHRYPPFVQIRDYSDGGRKFWGFGELENIHSIQRLFNEVIREQVANFRRSGNKYLVNEDALTDELREAIESDEPDLVAPVRVPTGQPLSELIVAVERKPLPEDVYALDGKLQDALQQVLGVNDFQSGSLGPSRMSATAAAVVDGLATLRAQEKVNAVERASAEIGTHLLLLCQEFLTEETAVRIAGPEAAEWVRLDRDSLHGEFQVHVEGGSTQSVNPETRKQRGLQTFQTVIPVLQELGMDPMPATRQALKDLGYDPDQIARQAPPPPAQPQGGPEQLGAFDGMLPGQQSQAPLIGSAPTAGGIGDLAL